MSTPPLRPSTNPYAAMLTASLDETPGVRPQFFSWRRALLTRFDVMHMHWPESLLNGANRFKTFGRRSFFLLLLLKIRLLRIALVRTVHNIELPQDISRSERWLLLLCERWTTLRIRLNVNTEVSAGSPCTTVLHGHYRDWFEAFAKPKTVAGRLAFVGLIRRYKATPELARAFFDTAATMPELSLHICGRPSTDELAAQLRAVAAADARVQLHLDAVTDAELVGEVSEAELVVLPYAEMHNSGATLAALSLDRPVLVPENRVNEQLADEVGPGWVHMFRAPLEAQDITGTLRAIRAAPAPERPDLAARDWRGIGEQHAAAYGRAIELAHRRHDIVSS